METTNGKRGQLLKGGRGEVDAPRGAASAEVDHDGVDVMAIICMI